MSCLLPDLLRDRHALYHTTKKQPSPFPTRGKFKLSYFFRTAASLQQYYITTCNTEGTDMFLRGPQAYVPLPIDCCECVKQGIDGPSELSAESLTMYSSPIVSSTEYQVGCSPCCCCCLQETRVFITCRIQSGRGLLQVAVNPSTDMQHWQPPTRAHTRTTCSRLDNAQRVTPATCKHTVRCEQACITSPPRPGCCYVVPLCCISSPRRLLHQRGRCALHERRQQRRRAHAGRKGVHGLG